MEGRNGNTDGETCSHMATHGGMVMILMIILIMTMIFNLQQDVIVAVCSTPSFHMSEMEMASSTSWAREKRLSAQIASVRTP